MSTAATAVPWRPFPLAFPVHELAVARSFYAAPPGCPEGRSSPAWVDFDLSPVRFKGLAGEQAPLFFPDPSGNALEFKACADAGQRFAEP